VRAGVDIEQTDEKFFYCYGTIGVFAGDAGGEGGAGRLFRNMGFVGQCRGMQKEKGETEWWDALSFVLTLLNDPTTVQSIRKGEIKLYDVNYNERCSEDSQSLLDLKVLLNLNSLKALFEG
jgi:hypothetical protein